MRYFNRDVWVGVRLPNLTTCFLNRVDPMGFSSEIARSDTARTIGAAGSFLELWGKSNPFYSALTCNCQTFAHELFRFFFYEGYEEEVGRAEKMMQLRLSAQCVLEGRHASVA